MTPDGRPSGEATDPLAAHGRHRPVRASARTTRRCARLFPDAYADDEEAAAEFRRFTERSLRDVKLAHARTVLATLDGRAARSRSPTARPRRGSARSTTCASRSASRLGLDEDNHEAFYDLPPRSTRPSRLFHLYDWLTFLQETLVHAVTGCAASRSTPTD